TIDHIAVGPHGEFHIETNTWTGDILFSDRDVEQKEDIKAQPYRYEIVLKELFREKHLQADVIGLICFPHPEARLVGKSQAFMAVKPDQLVSSIQMYKPKHPLTESQVAEIAALIEQNSKVNSKK